MAAISGGGKLVAALQAISRNANKPAVLEVGFLEGATYPDGTSVPLIAALNEFGVPSKGQPPRPFFRNMIAAKSPEWPKAVGNLLVANSYDAEKTLGQVGAAIAGQLKQSIVDTNSPPLAPATVAKKGSAKPLIDTSVMINSVDFVVKS